MDHNSAQLDTRDARRLLCKRSPIYNIGFGLLFTSCILYILAFVLPFWFKSREDDDSSWGILWSHCSKDILDCTKQFKLLLVSRCLSCLCLAGCLLLLVVALYENCRLFPSNYHSRKLEWFTLALAFVATVANALFIFYYLHPLRDVKLGLGYFINSFSIVLLYGSGAIIAQANRAPNTRQSMVWMSTEMHQRPQPGVHFQPSSHTPMMHQPAPNAVCAPYPSPPYPPSTPPPPYTLPPAYPGENQPPISSSFMVRDQRHSDANAPLIQESKHSPKK